MGSCQCGQGSSHTNPLASPDPCQSASSPKQPPTVAHLGYLLQATEDNLHVLCDLSPCTQACTPASAPPVSRSDAGSCAPGVPQANENTGPLTALPALCLPSRAVAESAPKHRRGSGRPARYLRTTPPRPPRPRPGPAPRPLCPCGPSHPSPAPRLLLSGPASPSASTCEARGRARQHGHSWPRRPGAPSHHGSFSPYGLLCPSAAPRLVQAPPQPPPGVLPSSFHPRHTRRTHPGASRRGRGRRAGTRWARGGSACHAHARAPPPQGRAWRRGSSGASEPPARRSGEEEGEMLPPRTSQDPAGSEK